jgi:ABC-type Fe3+ transport system permease subunit
MKPNTTNSQSVNSTVGGALRPPRIPKVHWLGVLPFFVFSGLFLIGPTLILAYRSLEASQGGLTIDNYRQLASDTVMNAYGISIRISVTTAILGGLIGFLIAWVVSRGGLPPRFRLITTTFSGVAANFAGVPLASAYVFTLGRVGLLTALLKFLGVDLYKSGFSLYSFLGLTVVYLYFQIPLMVLTILPALDGLKRKGLHLDYMRLRAFPFGKEVEDFLAGHKLLFVVEQNRDAQLKSLLTLETAVEKSKLRSILHYSGLPISSSCIVEGVLAEIGVVTKVRSAV